MRRLTDFYDAEAAVSFIAILEAEGIQVKTLTKPDDIGRESEMTVILVDDYQKGLQLLKEFYEED